MFRKLKSVLFTEAIYGSYRRPAELPCASLPRQVKNRTRDFLLMEKHLHSTEKIKRRRTSPRLLSRKANQHGAKTKSIMCPTKETTGAEIFGYTIKKKMPGFK